MIRKVIYRAIVMVAAVVSLGSCARVQEACGVVAEADSLRAVGQAFTDSVAIADAAETLYPVRLFYPTDYAHANYYYGRLLREHGDHPAAMEAFLRTVHSRTRDHAIKGRAYCNMGIMAGLATEHELAYDMYKCSAEEFLVAQDTTAYYYALIDMAFELAENKQKDEAIALTNTIECECNNYDILTKIWETRADAYIQAEVYDSAVYCVKKLHARGNQEPTGYLYAAQAYYWLGQNDSALYYANKTMEISNYHGDKFNVLYILSHCDSTLTMDDMLTLTSEREDIRYYEYEPMREAFIQAAQLLEQDLNRKPDLRWLIAIIATSIVIGIGIIVYVRKRKRQHQLYSQKAAAAQETHRTLSEQNQQLVQQQVQHKEKALAEIETFCSTITPQNIKEELCWKDFNGMCAVVNRRMFGLADKLKATNIVNEKEFRLCILVAIGQFNNKEMADILFYDDHSVRSVKSRIAGKLGVSGKNMRSFFLKLAIGG